MEHRALLDTFVFCAEFCFWLAHEHEVVTLIMCGSRRYFICLNTKQAMARHADPRTARLLPKLVPEGRLGAFKARLARRVVTLEGNRPVEVVNLRENRGEKNVVFLWGGYVFGILLTLFFAVGQGSPQHFD